MYLILLLGSMIGGDVDRLGHEEWTQREAAHERLKSYGLLAAPALLKATRSESPEVRLRANQLLGKYRRAVADLRAARVLTMPDVTEEFVAAFFYDDTLRLHVFRLAEKVGCVPYCYESDWLFPAIPCGENWSQWKLTPDELVTLLFALRTQWEAKKDQP